LASVSSGKSVLAGDDVCLVLASDGLTNVLGPIQVAAVIDEEECVSQIGVDRCEDLVYRDKHTNLARVLVANAIRNWRHLRADNVTAITVMFDSPYADLPVDHACVEEFIGNSQSIDKVFIDDPECMVRISPSSTLKLYTYRTPIVYKGARDPHFSVVDYTGPGFMTHTEERLLEERYRKSYSEADSNGVVEDDLEVASMATMSSEMDATVGCDDQVKAARSAAPILIESHAEAVVISTEVKATPSACHNDEDGTDEEEEVQPAPVSQGSNKRSSKSPPYTGGSPAVPEKRITRSASRAPENCATPSRTVGVEVRRATGTVTRRGPCRSSCVNVEDKVITPSGSVDIKIHVESSLTPTFGMITRSRDRNATTLLVDVRSPTPRSSAKRSSMAVPQIRSVLNESDSPSTTSPLTGSRKRPHRLLSVDSSGVTPVVHRLSLDTPRRNSTDLIDTGSIGAPAKASGSSFRMGSKWSLSKLDRKPLLKEETSTSLELGEPPSKMRRIYGFMRRLAVRNDTVLQ
ncbi:hypothetical protein ANCDUO_12365, partial [Ancylostoma duodenale]